MKYKGFFCTEKEKDQGLLVRLAITVPAVHTIDTIEIALRTKLIYHMSQAHGGLWYMDGTLFNNANLHAKQLQHLQVEFAESGEVFAKDYRRQHPNQIQNGWQSDENHDALDYSGSSNSR